MYDCIGVGIPFSGVRFRATFLMSEVRGSDFHVCFGICIGWVGDTPKIHCVSP
jgi:hypothetical protein